MRRLVPVLVIALGFACCTPTAVAQGLKAKLDKKATFPALPSGTSLKDALEFLSDRFSVKFTVNEAAFKDAGFRVDALLASPVQFPAQKKVPLRTVVQKLLKQVGATYRIKKQQIIIVPAADRPPNGM